MQSAAQHKNNSNSGTWVGWSYQWYKRARTVKNLVSLARAADPAQFITTAAQYTVTPAASALAEWTNTPEINGVAWAGVEAISFAASPVTYAFSHTIQFGGKFWIAIF
jgi:hypothetical protein